MCNDALTPRKQRIITHQIDFVIINLAFYDAKSCYPWFRSPSHLCGGKFLPLIFAVTNSVKALIPDIAQILQLNIEGWFLLIRIARMRCLYRELNIFAAYVVNATNLGVHPQMQIFTTTVIRISIIKLPQVIA